MLFCCQQPNVIRDDIFAKKTIAGAFGQLWFFILRNYDHNHRNDYTGRQNLKAGTRTIGVALRCSFQAIWNRLEKALKIRRVK
jgi:hypothetical protein